MIGNNFVLWEDENFVVKTPFNPHLAYREGPHLVIVPRANLKFAWEDIKTSTGAFELAAKVCKIMDDIDFTPWFNIQANGNWGLLPGATPFFHVHIYGRNKTDSWGKPVTLPEAPGTYQNEPMPETDRARLTHALNNALGPSGAKLDI